MVNSAWCKFSVRIGVVSVVSAGRRPKRVDLFPKLLQDFLPLFTVRKNLPDAIFQNGTALRPYTIAIYVSRPFATLMTKFMKKTDKIRSQRIYAF